MAQFMARTKHYCTTYAYFGNSGAEIALLHTTFMYTPLTPPFLVTIVFVVHPRLFAGVQYVLIAKHALGHIS